jgi:hypothetical protein
LFYPFNEPSHSSIHANPSQQHLHDQTAIDYFIMRLSELEYRLRQTETFIKLSSELKDTHTSKKT